MRIDNLYFDVSMVNQHKGLESIIKRHNGKLDGYSVFINKKWDRVKMLTPDGVLLYLRQKNIEPRTIKYLPACVGGGQINYTKALRKAIDEAFVRRTERG